MAQGNRAQAQTDEQVLETLRKACEKCGCYEECDEDCMLGISNPDIQCSKEKECSEDELKMCRWYYYITFFSECEECDYEDDYEEYDYEEYDYEE